MTTNVLSLNPSSVHIENESHNAWRARQHKLNRWNIMQCFKQMQYMDDGFDEWMDIATQYQKLNLDYQQKLIQQIQMM